MVSTVTKFIRKSSFIVALALHLAAVSVANAQVVPDAPQNLAAANHSSTTDVRVILTWDTPDNIGDSQITHVCHRYRRRLLNNSMPPQPYWEDYPQPSCVSVSDLSDGNSVEIGNLQSGNLHEFSVALQNSAGRSNWAVVSFTPGFSPTLTVQPTSVAENAAATEVTVTVTLGKGVTLSESTPVTVSVGEGTATAGTDYTAIDDFSVTVPGGSLTATGKFTLTPVDDNMAESDETIYISGTATNFLFADASLTIVDDDESPPAFASEQLTREIAENTAANTNVGAAIPAATDANSDPLTYTMEGTDAASFTFNASTRQIKTKSAVTYDHEAKSSYSVTIKASDATSSDTVSVTINVTDVAEPPSAPSAPTVSGASTTSLSVSWSAPSNTGKPAITSYDLQYRAGSTGNWSSGPQDQTTTSATIGSLAASTSYQVQVRATNDEGDSAWSSHGTGSTSTPVNSPPAFASEQLTREIAENTAANTNVGAAIPAATDANSDPLTYTMEGTDAASFTFNASTRQIKTKSAVTYDHEAKSSYSVTIKASDATSSDTVSVTINVTDVAEPPSAPSAPTVSGASTTSLSVSWSAPSNTGKPAITSYDLQYRAGSTGNWSSGPQDQTTTSATIGSLAASTSYQVQVRATNDEGDSAWSSHGTGSTSTPVNSPPAFASEQLTREIAENTAANTNVGAAIPAATDANSDPLTYTMEGTDAASFTFNASTRQIKTKSAVTYDHEAKSSYSVTIKASDATSSDTVSVTINVTDVAEPPSAPSAPTVSGASTTSLSVSWSAPSNTGKPAITSYDLQYRAGSTGNWSSGPQDQTTTSATIGSLAASTSYQVQVRATNDEGDSAWSSHGTGSTSTPVNSPPAFASEQLTREIAENTAANTNVGAAIPAATDANSDPLTYTMEGTDAASFTFNASTRQIKTKSAVTYDHEAKSSYSVTIKASDATSSDTVSVTINVTDVAEPPSAPSAPTVSGASTTSLSVSWSAPSNTGKPAITSYDLQYRAGSTGNWSSGPQDQTTTSATIGSLAASTSYQVQVRATNDEGDSAWSSHGTGSTSTGSTSTSSTSTDLLVSLSVSPNPVMEGSSVTVAVVLSDKASSDMMVPLTVTQDSSEADDHDTLSSIRILPNRVSATDTIATNQDTDSDDETFTVALGTTLPPGCVAGSPAKITVTIVDDDRTNPLPPGEPPPIGPDDPTPSSPSCGEDDREDLERFYETSGGVDWHENENWNSTEPLGEWFGVGTDEDGSVISLLLSENSLSGDMPTRELLCLNKTTELKELALWGNDDLSGEVPEELVLAVERAALRDIAEMLNLNPEWFENYEDPFDFEDWHTGVTTDDEERVIELDFTEEDITGEIPESVFELRRLEEISTGCGITLEVEAPERVSVMMPDDCAEEIVSSGDGGCTLGSGDSSVFGLFLVTLLAFAVLGRARAR